MLRHITLLFFVLFSLNSLTAQNTVGLLSFDFSQHYNGYNLIYPHNQPTVFLLNNCGEIVHSWTDQDTFRPGNTAYIRPNGDLIKTKRSADFTNDVIWAGGGGETVEIRTWDNDLLWSFTLNDSTFRLHHDIEPLPNGNILMIVWERYTAEEAIAAGRDPELLPDGEVWSDNIIEVKPIGTDSFEIVWEWKMWDHLVQDFDESKDNFGDVANSPGKLDINFTTNDGGADWLHCNAIDYNPFLNQIMLCSPFLSEIYIIDRQTTTEQAAGTPGDFMFRWGNNRAFRQGTEEDQQLFNPHDAHWIGDFIPPSNPDAGKVAVYNNQAGPDYSAVNILSPFFDMYEGYFRIGEVFAPLDFEWTYVNPDTALTYSTGLSSVQLLPNGNTLVCAGRTGYAYELNSEDEVIWEYRTPLRRGARVDQGEELVLNDNLTFRMDRYPMDYDAFDGRDLSSKGFIETNPDEEFCDITSSTEELESVKTTYVFPNPATNQITVEWMSGGEAFIEIVDMNGRIVQSEKHYGGRAFLDVSSIIGGIYFVRIDGKSTGKLVIAN